jgi:hypothetical protein
MWWVATKGVEKWLERVGLGAGGFERCGDMYRRDSDYGRSGNWMKEKWGSSRDDVLGCGGIRWDVDRENSLMGRKDPCIRVRDEGLVLVRDKTTSWRIIVRIFTLRRVLKLLVSSANPFAFSPLIVLMDGAQLKDSVLEPGIAFGFTVLSEELELDLDI